MHKDRFGLAASWGFITAFFFLCGLPWFQGLAKTWIVSHVGDRLTALSKQMDDVQVTTSKMQTELAAHQSQLDQHQKEITEAQAKLGTNQTDIARQQSNITNQYRELSEIQNQVATAQTNLDAQEKKVEDVEFLVQNLFSKMVTEDILGSDTNRVKILNFSDGASQAFIFLEKAAVPNSIHCVGQNKHFFGSQFPLTGLNNIYNVAISYFGAGNNPAEMRFSIQYLPDTRETNTVKLIEFRGTQVYFDGNWFRFNQDHYGP
jgi:TolA-binding protein